jgi:hypothetical protein
MNPLPIDIAIANEGFENFTFEILEKFPMNTDKEILYQNERKWIDYYDAENNPLHYNVGQGRYNLWDTKKVHHDARRVGNGVGKSFNVKAGTFGNHPWNRTGLPIGAFCEFVSPTIIYDLSQKWS